MVLKDIGATQVKVEGLQVLDFFDDKFIGMIKKHFTELDFQHFCLYVLDKDKNKIKERLSISHDTMDDKRKCVVTVDAGNPDSLKKLLNVIKEYDKEKGL